MFHRPRHPYSMGLLRSVPRLDRPRGSKLETIEGPAAQSGERLDRLPFRAALPLSHRGLRPGAAAAAAPTPAGFRAATGMQRSRQARSPGRPPAALLRPPLPRAATPLLSVRNLTKHFAVRGGLRGTAGTVRAVQDVSFDIYPGETLGLVGESGCGKTTVGRLILRLEEPTAGEIHFEGVNLSTAIAGAN